MASRTITGWSLDSPWGADARRIFGAAEDAVVESPSPEPNTVLEALSSRLESAARRWGSARVGLISIIPPPRLQLRNDGPARSIRGPRYTLGRTVPERSVLLSAATLLDESEVDAMVVLGATRWVAGALLIERHGTSQLRLSSGEPDRADGRLWVGSGPTDDRSLCLPSFEHATISAVALACCSLSDGVACPPGAHEPDRLVIDDGVDPLGVELVS